MRIIINNDFGGYSLSHFTSDALGGIDRFDRNTRTNPALIALIDRAGAEKVGGVAASLKVVEIPDGAYWHIIEHDGLEQIVWSTSPINWAY
jgi:hypothetical protein